ncbi:transmembrane and immunoglobulin domain-containing protein 2 [Tupaia chinensis]|uniref:transmembrane and immunoglobulin domain-containing protein 2 n=1 Tax=Tupaia chinensis TaxID=246437 RepID=UPI000FFB339A|nr:transmembrane and immunoglobulin domain-containing protein 2 [Tupaia chinensis]
MAAHFTGEETEAQDSPSALLQGCLRRSLQQPLRPKVGPALGTGSLGERPQGQGGQQSPPPESQAEIHFSEWSKEHIGGSEPGTLAFVHHSDLVACPVGVPSPASNAGCLPRPRCQAALRWGGGDWGRKCVTWDRERVARLPRGLGTPWSGHGAPGHGPGAPGTVLGPAGSQRRVSGRQWPESLRAREGSQVTLVCQVAQTQAWERLRLQWTKDGAVLCEPAVANGSLSGPACGPQGRLSWRPPGALALQLDRVSANDSGHYLCQAAVEIPELEEAEGNATRLLVDAVSPLHAPAGNALYSNVLYQPRRAPKKTEAWAGQRKVLDARGEDQTGPSAYSDSLPQPGACQPRPDRILALS